MATTLSKIFHQLLDDYAISLSYTQYAEKFGMTILSNTRKCARCGQPAGIKNPLYSSKEGKLCRNCLPFQMTITEGKTQLVITDRAKFDAYIRKETWEQAYYEVCNEERAHLDGMLKPMAQTSLNLYLSERKWSRLCHCRMVYHHEVLDKYVNFGNLFRSYMLGWMQCMFEEWQKHWYYKRTWRFDPLQSKMDIGNGGYKWEQFYPLLNDPAIHSAGVEIGARVEVTSGITGTIHGTGQYVKGRVVFRHKYSQNGHCAQFDTCTKDKVCCPFCYKERAVDCTHVAITTIPLSEVPENDKLDSKGREWAKTTENNKEVKLAPEEHYVALRSFVQGIAEVGLEAMFASRYPDDPLSLPFGFNTLMQKQILYCLKDLCPNACKSILYKAVGYILESAPDEWILQRKSLLDDTYGFTTILKDHEFWEMSDKETQKRIVTLLGKLQPSLNLGYYQNRVIMMGTEVDLHPGQPVMVDGLGQAVPFIPLPLNHVLDVPVTAIRNGERPIDFAAFPIRVHFPVGSVVTMCLMGDHEVFAGDLVELINDWLSVHTYAIAADDINNGHLPQCRADMNGRPGQTIRVVFMADITHTYPAEGVRGHHPDIVFHDELVGTFE